MSEQIVIVLDAGTGGGRAVAVDRQGKVRAATHRTWSYFEAPGLEMIGSEFHPGEFKALLAECCRAVTSQLDPRSIVGVTTTGMREGCVFLDKDDKELYAGSNHDVRGIQYAQEVEDLLGMERAYRIGGHWPPWLFLAARWYWFQRDNPELLAKVARVLMINDWLVHWLCGEAVGEPTNAGETMLFDIDAREWSAEMLETCGIGREMLPRIAPCGTVAGKVTKDAADATGLPAKVKVLTGVADTQAGLIAGKVLRPGEAGIVAGSTAPLMMVMDESRRDPKVRLWIGCHPIPGRWVAESNSGDAGIIYRLYVEGHLGRWASPKTNVYREVEALAAEAGVGAYGARAYLGPMIWDLKAMTPAARAGLFLTYPVGDANAHPGVFARAILENIAFALRGNYEQAAEVAGTPSRTCLAGGMTRSRLFRRIVAGVLGAPVEVMEEPEATAVGCAVMAFTGLGLYPDLETAAAAMIGPLAVTDPDRDEHDEYNDLYEQWRADYPQMMGQED